MSRALIFAELSAGPKSHAELHAASRRAGAISKSVGGLHEMQKRGEVAFALSAAGHRMYFLTPVGAEAAKAAKPSTRAEQKPLKHRPDPRQHGRSLGVVYETTSINACARACAAFAAYYGPAVLVLDAQRECSVYLDGSVAAARAWNAPDQVVGRYVHTGDHADLTQLMRDISDAIEHQIEIHAARSYAYGPTRGAPAPISTGVPQS